jgi:hypothetical protein
MENKYKEVTLMSEEQPSEYSLYKNPLMPFITGGLGYLVKYIAYGFLTPVILLTFSAFVFDYIAIQGPELPFLQYFTSILPINSGGTMHLNTDDIMLGYGSLTTALFLLSIIGKGLMRILGYLKERTFPSDAKNDSDGEEVLSGQTLLSHTIKRRLIISSIVITAVFAVSIIVIPFAPLAKGESKLTWYVIFIVFYVIALIFNAIYTGIDSLSDKMFRWTTSNIR